MMWDWIHDVLVCELGCCWFGVSRLGGHPRLALPCIPPQRGEGKWVARGPLRFAKGRAFSVIRYINKDLPLRLSWDAN